MIRSASAEYARRSPVSQRHRRAAVGLLLLAATGLLTGLRQAPPPALEPGRIAPVALATAVPVNLDIPAIDLTGPVIEIGLDPDGTVELPPANEITGWYRYGPAPGEVGAAVILGHVDSYTGPAVFFRLSALRPGDQIHVTRADRSVAHFLVHNVSSYPKSEFPTREIYESKGFSALHLVTCGGEFDTSARSYLSNIVVYSALIGITPPG